MTAMTVFDNSGQPPLQQQPWESWGAAADARATMLVKPAQADLKSWRSEYRFIARPWRIQTNLEDLQQMDVQVSSWVVRVGNEDTTESILSGCAIRRLSGTVRIDLLTRRCRATYSHATTVRLSAQ